MRDFNVINLSSHFFIAHMSMADTGELADGPINTVVIISANVVIYS
jgi:hypothetical protein